MAGPILLNPLGTLHRVLKEMSIISWLSAGQAASVERLQTLTTLGIRQLQQGAYCDPERIREILPQLRDAAETFAERFEREGGMELVAVRYGCGCGC
jgi:hypothetical protein